MDYNYFNFALPPYQLPFPTYLCINPYLSLPFITPSVQNPAFLVKIQAEAVNKSIKTPEMDGSNSKNNKNCKKRPKFKQQVSFRENNSVQKYNDFNKNVLPNNIHLVLSYIRRTNKSGAMVDKIINKLSADPLLYSKKKFYSYQNYLKERLANIKYNHMIEAIITYYDSKSPVFTLQQQQFYNKMTRILIFNFLRDGALTNVLSSPKIVRTKKDEHLKIQRMMMQKIEVSRNDFYSY